MQRRKVSPSAARLQWKLVADAWTALATFTVVELGVADRLAAGPRPIAGLARDVGADEDALFRLLRALSTAGLFVECAPRVFEVTPLGSCLAREGSEVHALALMFGDEHRRSWAMLTESVRTGKSAFETAHGVDLFAYLNDSAEADDRFRRAMADHAALNHGAVLDAFDFSGSRHVVDVGGGDGAFLASLLSENKGPRGTLLDRPRAAEAARRRFDEAGLAARATAVAGDFFEGVPAGGDVYVLSAVLHDFRDEDGVRILGNISRAMTPDATLLVAEIVLPTGNEPSFGKLLDLNMMVTCPGGRERTRDEHASLLSHAGLRVRRTLPTRTLVSVVEATLA
jgi:hypothetical protein